MIKKIYAVIIIASMILLSYINFYNYKTLKTSNTVEPVKISVIQYRATDDFIAKITERFKAIEKEKEGKVQFTFYDSKNSQELQNQHINNAIKQGTNLLFVNLVDIKAADTVLNKIKENNLPVVLYNREPLSLNPVKSYSRTLYIGNDSIEGGIEQGKLVVDLWKNKKELIDKNKDNIMQYILLSGGIDNKEASQRSKYSIKTINDAGIQTEELRFIVANFDKELAKKATELEFIKHGNDIEVIIANDDSMAAGAVEALQELGYNKGDLSKTIPVIGFDATEEARDLISKGFMTGTVIQNTDTWADTIYKTGMNLFYKKNVLEGVPYKFDETGVAIRIPSEGLIINFGSND